MEPRGPEVAVPEGAEDDEIVVVGVIVDAGDEEGGVEVTGGLLAVPWRHFQRLSAWRKR